MMRQRINRVHYSIYDIYGNSALNARPYSLYQANPAKISGWIGLPPIVNDARVFTDKIARHPEVLGVRGAIKKSPGIK